MSILDVWCEEGVNQRITESILRGFGYGKDG